MDGKNQLQTSFEQEFNRLTFLASIAAGSTLSDEHSVDLKSSSKSAQIVVSSPHCEMRSVNNPPIPDGSLLNNLNGIHMTIKRPADNTLNNDIVRSVIDDSKTNVNDSGKVNDFFMSPNVLHVASNSSNNTSENTNTIGIQKAYSSVVQPSSNNPRNILPNSPINQSPLMGNNILVTNSFLQQSTSLSGFVQSDGNSHINTHSQQSKLQNSVFNNASPVTTQAASITQQLNPPLVISQASPSNAEKILSQSPVSCSTGQTILLPANFAGMSGRVLILNNPGKPPQAIAITPSSANIQQLQATNLQFQPTVSVSSELSSGLVTSKPVLLLPNNVISKVEQQPSTSLQQPHLVNNALHMVASQNPQLRVQQSTLSNKQMPQLQQVQPVSLSSFQSIRPKSFLPNIRNVQPKSNNQGISRFSINSATANQGLRLSHFSNQSPNSPKQPTIISAKVSGTPVSEKNSISSISVIATSPESSSVLSNTSLLNNFDKTMTQHLLTLEKTDPHLFQHRGKMPITQFQKSEDNPNMQLDQANKLKSLLQSTPTTSLSNSFELSQKQQRSFVVHQTSPQSVKTVSLTQGSISTTSVQGNQSALKSVPNISTGLPNQAVTSTSSAILATQMMPQRQHASLQNILKLQQQQQQSKTVVNKSQHLKQHSQEHLQIQQQQQQQLQQQQLQQQQQSILQQARQLQLQHQQLQQHRYIQKKQQLQQHSLQPQTNQQQTQLLQQQQLQQLQQLMCKGSPMSSTSGSDVSMMEKKLIGQVKDLQESSNHNKRENAPTSISIQPNILKGSQKNLFTLKQDSSAINPSPPLKLLSSLTNMVNSSTSLSTSASDSITNPQKSISMNAPLTAGLTDQQNIQPVLFQLTGGGNILSTHMLNTTRLTPAQLIELQKTLSLQQNKQLNAIRAVITQPQSKVTSSIVSSVNQTQNLASCLASKNALQNFVMVSNSEQSKPAVTSSSNKNVQLSQQVQQLLQKNQVLSQGIKSNGGVGKVPDNLVVNKVLQEQLKHMTLAQREQLMRQYMPGKMSAASVENVTAPMLLASILKNKQVFPMPSVIPAKPSLNSQPSKKLTSKIVSRGLKRTNEIIKKEPEDHPLVKKWKGVLYEDHVRYQNPDYKSPFASVNDAMKRILPYHVSQDVENQNNEKDKFEEHFELFASNFQDRCSAIFERLNHLLFKDSQVISPLPDEIMIGRLFISEEQERFMHQKTAISEGRAFVVRNEEKGELECVEVAVVENANTDSSTNAISLNLSEENQLDNRLRIAHKDIRNIDLNDSDIDEEDTETFDGENEDNVYPVDNIDDDYEEEMGTGEIMDEEEIETEDIYTEENEEEIENEELNEFSDHISTYREDSELAAATTNLLADLQQDDDYNLDFDL